MISMTPAPRSGVQHLVLLVCLVVVLVAFPYAWVRVSTALYAFAATSGRVYTVAELERQIAHDPESWLGRTVLVQGVTVVYHRRIYDQGDRSLVTTIYLSDPGAPQWAAHVLLIRGPPDPLLAALRHLPLLGYLAPRPQAPRLEQAAVYRIQLSTLPRSAWSSCEVAVLLDAA